MLCTMFMCVVVLGGCSCACICVCVVVQWVWILDSCIGCIWFPNGTCIYLVYVCVVVLCGCSYDCICVALCAVLGLHLASYVLYDFVQFIAYIVYAVSMLCVVVLCGCSYGFCMCVWLPCVWCLDGCANVIWLCLCLFHIMCT